MEKVRILPESTASREANKELLSLLGTYLKCMYIFDILIRYKIASLLRKRIYHASSK